MGEGLSAPERSGDHPKEFDRGDGHAQARLRTSLPRGRDANPGRQALAARRQKGGRCDRLLDPERWQEFRRRYRKEIGRHAEELERLRDLVREETVTLVFGARDELHNDAVVLREVLLSRE